MLKRSPWMLTIAALFVLVIVGCGGGGDVGPGPDVPREVAQRVDRAHDAISSAVDEGREQGGAPEALRRGREAAEADPAVEEAVIAGTTALWVKYRDAGVDIWDVSPPPPEIIGTAQVDDWMLEPVAPVAYPDTASFLIISTIHHDPAFAVEIGALEALHRWLAGVPGMTVPQMLIGEEATVEAYKDLNRYGIIHLDGHGSAGFLAEPDLFLGPSVAVQTGEPAPPSVLLASRYWGDWIAGRLYRGTIDWGVDRKGKRRVWWVTHRFFSHYYQGKSFPSSIVHLSACKTLKYDMMAAALTGAGAGVVLGWTDNQGVSARAARALFQRMTCGTDLDTALSQLPDSLRRHGTAELQYYPYPAGGGTQFTSWCPEQRIAANYPQYDDVGGALGFLGHDHDTVDLHSINSADDLSDYSMYAVNCAGGLDYISDATARGLTEFVHRGGKLYTSDWAYSVVQAAFPGKITVPPNPYSGYAEIVRATIVDSALRTLMGGATHLDLDYDLGAWVPITAVAGDVTVLLEGEYEYGANSYAASARPPSHRATHDRGPRLQPAVWIQPTSSRTRGPLAVTFRHGGGRVVHTTFHYHAQVGSTQLQILEYLLLTD